MSKSRRERRAEQRKFSKSTISKNDFTNGSKHLIKKMLDQDRMVASGSDQNYNYYMASVNGHQIRFCENLKNGEFGPEITTGLAKAMGFDTTDQLMASDSFLDWLNDMTQSGRKFPLVKKL